MKDLSFADALQEIVNTLALQLLQQECQDSHMAALAATAETATSILSPWLRSDAGKPGRAYLKERGISEETAQKFWLGFHPDHPTLLVTALEAVVKFLMPAVSAIDASC